jgi:uncharacterized protein YgbK (DUF1537 family)
MGTHRPLGATASTRPRSREELLGGLSPPLAIGAEQVAAAARTARRLVILDDDPTGTQTVADVPIITSWDDDDVRWALAQDCAGIYVLTNTRSLPAKAAADRIRQVVATLARGSNGDLDALSLVSRGDSTLRGHYPLETDVLADEHDRLLGRPVDGVVLVPAYVDAGRITVDSVHWVGGAAGFTPVGETEFASDPVFGYRSSDLREYVAEKTAGRWARDDVARITLEQLRVGGVPVVRNALRGLRDRRPVVVDAAADEDIRVLALAAIDAERLGSSLIYRVGPSFVRNRLGQGAHLPLTSAALAELTHQPLPERRPPRAGGGLAIVGSHVGLTTRQLARLTEAQQTAHVTLEVPDLLSAADPAPVLDAVTERALEAIADGDVVVQTSRELVDAGGGASSLAASARVSEGLVEIVSKMTRRTTPRWIVAKGGITSSDIATRALGIRRAWARGTLLPGIISLWEPADEQATPVPYVVFAGNVGDEDSLATAVARLHDAAG